MDDFDIKEPDESSFSNVKGFFLTLLKLWETNIQAEFQRDLYKQWQSLYMLRRYLLGFWTEEERPKIQQEFFNTLTLINQMQHAQANQNDKKEIELYHQAQMQLWSLADKISLKLHEHNLYTPIREKGSHLYN
jgi:hypothetical protein